MNFCGSYKLTCQLFTSFILKSYESPHLILFLQVYYHLGAYEESLTYALGAGDLFDVNDTSEYVETTISKCIDYYTKQRISNAEGNMHSINCGNITYL